MLFHGATWQEALGAAFISVVIFAVAMLLSLACGYFSDYFNWAPAITGIFLLIGFFVIISLIPLLLNLSRSFFVFIIVLLAVHITVTILSFALHYKSAGLISDSGEFLPEFSDALYFSVTTFTTLGYGDFQPLPSMRLVTSMEALAGMVSMAIGASLIWLWCQENMIPKEMAFFDGNRRHKKDLGITRVRIRTLTGKERKLKNWVLPPEEGDSFFWDDKREEWVKVSEDTNLPENAFVMGFKTDKKTT
jgi:hypothetical protein